MTEQKAGAACADPAVLVLIDVQNGFLRGKETAGLDGKIIKAVERGRFNLIIATRFVNAQGSLYWSALGWGAMREGPDAGIPEAVREKADLVIEKGGYSAAEGILRLRGEDASGVTARAMDCLSRMDTVYLAGCDTDACVLATAFAFWDAGIRPVILKDLCASNAGRKAHLDALRLMERAFGKDSVVRS